LTSVFDVEESGGEETPRGGRPVLVLVVDMNGNCEEDVLEDMVAGAVAGTVDNMEVEGESEDVDDAPPTPPPDDDLSVVVVELVVLVFVLDWVLSLSRL